MNMSHISLLPFELIEEIALNLDLLEYFLLSVVNKRLNQYFKDKNNLKIFFHKKQFTHIAIQESLIKASSMICIWPMISLTTQMKYFDIIIDERTIFESWLYLCSINDKNSSRKIAILASSLNSDLYDPNYFYNNYREEYGEMSQWLFYILNNKDCSIPGQKFTDFITKTGRRLLKHLLNEMSLPLLECFIMSTNEEDNVFLPIRRLITEFYIMDLELKDSNSRLNIITSLLSWNPKYHDIKVRNDSKEQFRLYDEYCRHYGNDPDLFFKNQYNTFKYHHKQTLDRIAYRRFFIEGYTKSRSLLKVSPMDDVD